MNAEQEHRVELMEAIRNYAAASENTVRCVITDKDGNIVQEIGAQVKEDR